MKHKKTSNKGFTLAELVMSLVVMSLLAGSVAGLSIALTDAYAHGKDFQQDMQTARNSLRYLSQTVKRSNLICALDSDELVIWAGDDNNDGGINVNELLYIAYDSSSSQITMYRIEFSSDFYESLYNYSVTLNIANNISYVRRYLTSNYWTTTSILGRNVDLLEFTTDADPPLTEMMKVKIQVSSGSTPVLLRNCASLRSPWTDRVEKDDGKWTLEHDEEHDD